jgi:site-specific recombinase XerD
LNITLETITHKGKRCVAIRFEYDFYLKEYIKKFPAVRWSQTQKTFYILRSDARLNSFRSYIEEGGYRYSVKANQKRGRKSLNKVALPALSAKKKRIASDYTNFLRGKRYSENTVKVYSGFIIDFLRHTSDKPSEALNEEDVRLFIQWAVGTLNYSVSTHRQMVSGFRHFAHFYPACSIHPDKIFMPKKDKKLPVVLSKEEILTLLQVTKNLKHRTALAMLYGCGLRIGELLHLELSCFDFNRRQLHIKNGKGRKERYATLPESMYPLIKNYYETYRPKHYFIENPKGGVYNPSSVRAFLKQMCKLAGIKKSVSPHSLRHSYATHLLESGTGIRHIQELLGHSRPETTMIYTHVTRHDLREIRSPLDTIIKERLPNINDSNLFLT